VGGDPRRRGFLRGDEEIPQHPARRDAGRIAERLPGLRRHRRREPHPHETG